MPTTHVSLLERLKVADACSADWNLLHEIYTPLVRGWLARSPELGAEADDLGQEVLLVLVKEVPWSRG